VEICDAISYVKDIFPRKFPHMINISVTEIEMKSIMHSSQKIIKNFSGCDGITIIL
jgi:hypothetical protein